jgi:hypothetical protein
MSGVRLLPVLLVAGLLAGGCGGHRLDLAAIRAVAGPTPTEQSWLRSVGRAEPRQRRPRAAAVRRRLEQAVVAGGGAVIRLSFRGADGHAPDLVIAAADPARYLRHGLRRVVRLLRHDPGLYVEVVDDHGRRVLEWTLDGPGGSLFVRRGLERCSPVVALGWPPNLAPCPSG